MDFYELPEIPGDYAGDHPVAAATTIATGATVILNAAGNALEAKSTNTGFAVGIAEQGVDNSGGSIGDKTVRVRRGVFSYALDSTNAPTKVHIGAAVYFTAPDTVSSLNTVTSKGGILLGFQPNGRAIVDLRRSTK